MVMITVSLARNIAEMLDHLADAKGYSPAELAAEAVARFVLVERQALDRVVEARLRQFNARDDGLTEVRQSSAD